MVPKIRRSRANTVYHHMCELIGRYLLSSCLSLVSIRAGSRYLAVLIESFNLILSLQLALDCLSLICFNPLLDVPSVPIQPCTLCLDRIKALGKALVKALGALALKELVNPVDISLTGEAGCADGDHRAQHRQSCRKSSGKLVPILSHPVVQCLDSVRVSSKGTDRHIYVLLLDFTSEWQSEGSLD